MAGENNYSQSIQQVKTDIETIIQYMGILDERVAKSATNLANAAKAISAATPQEMSGAVERQKKGINELNAAISEQSKKSEELAMKKKALTMLTGQEVENNKILTRNAKEQSVLQSKLVGEYKKLITQRDIAKRKLRDLIAAENQNVVAIKKAQIEYNRLTGRVNAANAATTNFAKTQMGAVMTSIQGIAGGVRNLMAAFGVIGGLYLFADMTKQAFSLARTLDSLNFAMKTVITDSQELMRTQSFLTEITERYGAELVTTTERYIKFLAAAKQSGVTLSDTERIFGTMTKAAGTLGLKTHELEGVYLALEQMLSKGKVTTEELRRQLGERLPGAFGIMAQALGVTTSELDRMLRAGEVLSSEALPKFATAVEKAYGIEQLERVDNLNAAVARMSNAWVVMVQNITESEGPVSNALSGMIDGVAKFISGMGMLTRSLDDVFREGKESGGNIMKDLEADMEKFGISIERAAEKRLPALRKEFQKTSKEYLQMQKNLSNDAAMSALGQGGMAALEIEFKKKGQLMAQQEEMLGVLQDVMGVERERQEISAEPVNLKNLDDLIYSLKKVEDEYKIATKELEDFKNSGINNPERLEALEIEQFQVKKLVDEYTNLLNVFENDQFDFSKDQSYDKDAGKANREFIAGKLKEAQEKYGQTFAGDEDARKAIQAEIDILKEALKIWDGTTEAKKRAAKASKDYTNEDAFKLLEGRLQREIEVQQEIRDNEENTLDERIVANRKFEAATIQLLNAKADYEVSRAEGRKDLILAIREQQEFDEQQIMKASLEQIELIQSQDFDRRMDEFDKLKEKDKNTLDQRVIYMKQAMHKRGATAEEIEEAIYKIEYEYLEKKLQDQIDFAHKELVIMAQRGEQTEEVLNEIRDLEGQLIDLRINKRKKDADDEKKTWEEKRDAAIEYLNAVADVVGQIGALFKTFSDRRISDIDDQMAAMNEMYENQLSNENLTDQRRKEIEDERERRNKELEKKKKQEKIKAAEAEKKFAAFQIGIQTSVAIMEAAPNVPLQILVAALGALQLATVLATPIPKYAKGRKGGKEEVAMLGDGGKHEPILDRHGNLKGISPNTPTLMKLDKGDTVLPSTNHLHKDYQSILDASVMTTLAAATVNNDSDKLARIFDKKLGNLKSEMQSGIKEGFRGVKMPDNKDISRLANDLHFKWKRDAI